MTNQERIDQLTEAQEMIGEAIQIIKGALKDTNNEANANAYIVSHLTNWAEGSNPYDMTIPRYIELLNEEGDTPPYDCPKCGDDYRDCPCEGDS